MLEWARKWLIPGSGPLTMDLTPLSISSSPVHSSCLCPTPVSVICFERPVSILVVAHGGSELCFFLNQNVTGTLQRDAYVTVSAGSSAVFKWMESKERGFPLRCEALPQVPRKHPVASGWAGVQHGVCNVIWEQHCPKCGRQQPCSLYFLNILDGF